MTLVLQDNEKIEKEIKINTIHGKGILYVTNTSVVIIIEKKGLLFERSHTQIASIEVTEKNKIKLTWPENNSLFDFTFRIKDAQYVVNDILKHHSYDNNFPYIMGVSHVIYGDIDKRKIVEERLEYAEKNISKYSNLIKDADLKVKMITDSSNKDVEILQAVEKSSKLQNILKNWSDYLSDIPNICFNRSKKIPKNIPNHLCWNDAWIDNMHDCFVTFNDYWREYNFQDDNVKRFYTQNKIPNCYCIPLKNITYKNGYPILDKETSISFNIPQSYIPTLIDDMIR